MWFSDHIEGKKNLSQFNNVFENITQVIEYQPDIVLATTNAVPDFISGIKVQAFHGFNAEKRKTSKNYFSHFNIRGFFDLYCTQGPSTTKLFKELSEKYKHFEVVETGWPKVDSLFPIQNAKKTSKPTNILIASTFSKKLSLACNPKIYQEISRLIKTKKYNFNLVLYPKSQNQL